MVKGGVYTRKQLYRRAVTKKNTNNYSYDCFNNVPEEDHIPVVKQRYSFKEMAKLYRDRYNLNKYYKKEKFHIKEVRFKSEVKVILIPQLAEYEYAGLLNNLWYSQDDYFHFHNEQQKEIEYNSKNNTL